MDLHRIGLAALCVCVVAAAGCPQPTKKTFDGGAMGGAGGDGGSGGSGGSGGAGGTGGSGGAGGAGGSGGTGGVAGGSMDAARDMGGADNRPVDTRGAEAGAPSAEFMNIYTTILTPKCGPMCHFAATNQPAMLNMSSAANAFMNLVGKAGTTNCMMQVRVSPGMPAMSLILKKLSATPPCGMRMPAGGRAPLTDPEIMTITTWIMNGAK
jgi:hypothetical protein